MSTLKRNSRKQPPLPKNKADLQVALKQRRLALTRQTVVAKIPLDKTVVSQSHLMVRGKVENNMDFAEKITDDPEEVSGESEIPEDPVQKGSNPAPLNNTPARHNYQPDENSDQPEVSSMVTPERIRRNWKVADRLSSNENVTRGRRRPSGNPPCQIGPKKNQAVRKPIAKILPVVKRSAALMAAAAKKQSETVGKKKGKNTKIDENICHLCSLAVCPLEQSEEGEDEWVGCTTCPRWFHVGCLLPATSEAALYFDADNFRCKFCT